MLHPDFPIVEGHYQMTSDWGVFLAEKYNRRIEDSDLVLWRPGMTIWVSIWENDDGKSQEELLSWIKEGTSKDAFEESVYTNESVTFYSYSLSETTDDERQPAFYCFALSNTSYVQMAIYYDEPLAKSSVKDLHSSLVYSG
ncbi:hypothetical protein [Grimontia sp. SpTr1]|uniref:hypothetical protein n=1 Tax=Grimontia sp. SpTr1 TaxID=2995319 RepID=UPI00248C7C23|nr:hypothetical protein [Grimontia sp. SpTr1]